MKTDKNMSTATNPDVRYTMDSVRTIEVIKDQIGDILQGLATERAVKEGRRLVTAEDVAKCVRDALRESLEQFTPKKAES